VSSEQHHGSKGGLIPATGAEKGPSNPPGFEESHVDKNSYNGYNSASRINQ